MGSYYSRVYKIDHGSTTLLGLYDKRYNSKLVREFIIHRKLSPFYQGLSDSIHETDDTIECPICFLYYPSNINFTRCCTHPICTECFVQVKNSFKLSVPCPFCMTDNVEICYQPPKKIKPCCDNDEKVSKRRKLLSAFKNIVRTSK